MDNLELYNKLRAVPVEAQKGFNNGRFSGTDINPMWRIKKLTEVFGPAGDGWWVENVKFWTEPSGDEILAFCTLELCLKDKRHLFGIGGSKALTQEKKGPYADDECYKKAYTDALSVACKSIGMGADIYWDKDKTKYDRPVPFDADKAFDKEFDKGLEPPKKKSRGDIVKEIIAKKDIPAENVKYYAQDLFGTPLRVNEMTNEQFDQLCEELNRR